MTEMTRREADADAWERGEHPCQLHGHITPNDPQRSDCERCGTDLSIPPEERGECDCAGRGSCGGHAPSCPLAPDATEARNDHFRRAMRDG